MSRATILAAGLLLAGAMAGCSSCTQDDLAVPTAQSRSATANPTASVSSGSDPVQFARCMREHGITWFADPAGTGTDVQASPPSNVDEDKLEAARQACQKYAGAGLLAPTLDPAVQERLLRYSKCVRENGFPDFPDMPTDGTGISLSKLGIDPKSPAFQAAQDKCRNLLPDRNGTKAGT
ncbi:hypothetical protein [Phytohabitans rumicis]|uniref:Lipoprotein n=1 Tax=Phytohabitans rumicis TaxID=1076125 RepID=A0A6V8LES5_9ACTN|nr:hypothetical protein [Phytohabitans rumicis]GFJ95723.1 hypothetical protein Prum_093650 [Phytohabitans rumicis]